MKPYFLLNLMFLLLIPHKSFIINNLFVCIVVILQNNFVCLKFKKPQQINAAVQRKTTSTKNFKSL